MRKLMLSCAAVAALIPVPLTPVQAAKSSSAWPAQDALAYCRELQQSEPDVKLGNCMAFFVTSDMGNLTQTCIYFDITGQLEGFGITFSECVRMIREETKG